MTDVEAGGSTVFPEIGVQLVPEKVVEFGPSFFSFIL